MWALGPWRLVLPVPPNPDHSPPPCRLGLDGMKMQVRAVGPKLCPCHHPALDLFTAPVSPPCMACWLEVLCLRGAAGPSWAGAIWQEC